jgi:hypothetical protein
LLSISSLFFAHFFPIFSFYLAFSWIFTSSLHPNILFILLLFASRIFSFLLKFSGSGDDHFSCNFFSSLVRLTTKNSFGPKYDCT